MLDGLVSTVETRRLKCCACGAVAAIAWMTGIFHAAAYDHLRHAIMIVYPFLVCEENVHTASVCGIVTGDNGEEQLIGSVRTSKLVFDPDQFI